jgi:hypothetical protein
MMQKNRTKYISLCALLSIVSLHAEDRVVTPLFTIRSQGFNSVRRLPGETGRNIFLYDVDACECGDFYGKISLTPEYTRSFRPHEIARSLFGDALGENGMLKIEGSRVAGRDPNALLADYFYLPTDFESTICFTPRIQNFLVDLNYYVGLDWVWRGLYMMVQTPLTWTKWALNARERILDEGDNGYDAGYFTPNALSRGALLDSFLEYARGDAPGVINQVVVPTAGPNEVFNVELRPLQFAKIRKTQSNITVSELRYYLGWNFLLCEDYHLGINLQASGPTGNRPKAEYLFEAQNGNGKHGEFGFGVNGHYTFCRSEDEDVAWTFEANIDVSHMFKARQRRTFDLKDKPLSRYMLAEKLGSEVLDSLQGATGTAADAQFKNVFTPVANITTFDLDVTVGAQVDFLAWIYRDCGNSRWDFGYNLWTRSCEKFERHCDTMCNGFESNTWALKGDAQVYGFAVGPIVANFNGAVPLSATENAATINGGTNFVSGSQINTASINAAKANPNIDNPQFAFGDNAQGNLTALRVNPTNDLSAANPQINTSIQPVFIQESDIDFVRIKGITQKLFTQWSIYNPCDWVPQDEGRVWYPYFAIGAEVEWAQNHNNRCDNDCEDDNNNNCDNDCSNTIDGTCVRSALSQWGIWAKFGVAYH